MIDELYEEALRRDSDIKNHLPILRAYAAGCDTVVECGFRGGLSATALLAGRPKKFYTLDWDRPPFQVDRDYLQKLRNASTDTEMHFFAQDTLGTTIWPCDLLFIDTFHTYEHLLYELILHSDKVTEYIVIHDTDEPTCPGMFPAVEDFLLDNETFQLELRDKTRPGLTVLKRVDDEYCFEYGKLFLKNLEFEVNRQKDLYYESISVKGSANTAWHEFIESQRERFANVALWPLTNKRPSVTEMVSSL